MEIDKTLYPLQIVLFRPDAVVFAADDTTHVLKKRRFRGGLLSILAFPCLSCLKVYYDQYHRTLRPNR